MVQAGENDHLDRALGQHLGRMAPRLSASLAQLRRDLRMVLGHWRGERHPLIARPLANARPDPRHRARAPASGARDTRAPDKAETAHVPCMADLDAVHLTIHLQGRARTIPVAPGQTILEAGLAAGLPMRFSCAMGGCGTCRVKLLSGRVLHDHDQGGLSSCLSPAERDHGYVLACVSRPATHVEVEAGVEPDARRAADAQVRGPVAAMANPTANAME